MSPKSRACVRTSSDRSYRNAGRMRLKMRGTVSTLWAKTSGRDSNTSRSSVGLPEKSVARISTPVDGVLGMDAPHRLGVQPRTLVGQVVAGDAGDGRVAQVHPLHALGHASRLVDVVVGGLARVDLAEVAAARALRAADEEGRLAVLPALEDVGAARPPGTRCADPRPSRGAAAACTPGPILAFVRIHSGLRSIGVSALRISSRSSLRPAGAVAAFAPEAPA